METKEIKMAKGKMLSVTIGRIQCCKYVGKFNTQSIQDKADTNLWYTRILGHPFTIEGSGDTPHAAIRDSIYRTDDRMKKMQQSIKFLEEALAESGGLNEST